MRKTIATLLIALSAIGAASAAQTEAPKQESFDQGGYSYVYTVVTDAKGGRTISGVRYPDATPFTLKVKGSRVEGETNGQPVAFPVADAKGAARDAEIYVIAKPSKMD